MKAVAVLVLCAALMAGAFATTAEVDTEVDVAAAADVAADVESEAVAEVETETETEAEGEAEAETEVAAEGETEAEAEVEAETEAEVETEAVAESETEAETEAEAETETEAEAAVEVEAEAEKPRRRAAKVAPRTLEKGHFMPKSRIVIVPKGDPRARDGSIPVMLPPVVAPATPTPTPVVPTPAVTVPATVPPAVVPSVPVPAGPAVVPNVPVGAGATVPTAIPAARPILKAGTPTSAACAQRRGTCKASSACTGNFQIVRGICSGPATITCCVPKAAAAKPTTTKPTTTNNKPASTTPASQCPVYANSPESSIKGNGGVMYRVVRIASQHFTGSADNTMTKATACAFARMAQDAAKAGIRLTINSGFRTYERQVYFWNCFQTKRCNNGNRAARPGNSNHGRGQALDINTGATSTKTYKWMAANASKYGFRRTVADEPWHWER